jgi:hypothetical protein
MCVCVCVCVCVCDLGIDGRVILKDRVRDWEGMVLIHLTQDRGQWRVLVNMVMNFRIQ